MPDRDHVNPLFAQARQHAVDDHNHSDQTLAIVTALEGLAREVQNLRISIERISEP